MLYSTFTFFLDICICMILLLYVSTYACAKHANFILHQNRTSNDSNLDRLLLCLLCSHYRVNIRLYNVHNLASNNYNGPERKLCFS